MRLGKESETVEYKKSTGELKEGVISIAAMLNKHNCGELYFGVRSDGVVVGQTLTEKTLRDVSQAIATHIEPELCPIITAIVLDNKACIKVTFEGDNTPYFAYGRAYTRIADEDRALSPLELRKYFTKQITEATPWDSMLSDRSTADIHEPALIRFIEKSNANGRMDYTYTSKKDILTKLDLLRSDRLTNTAKIMFCKKNDLENQMAIFASHERLTFNDIKRERGTVTDLVDSAEKYIKNNIKWRVEFDGSLERKEIPEIPMEAVREALINSFCHRDYSILQNNEISIYKNRVEIYNAGTFPHGLTPHDFIEGSERSIKRNPQLAQMLYYSKDVETFGTGLRRIANVCKNAGVRVDFQMLKTGFVVVFYSDETDKVPIYPDKESENDDKVPIYPDKKSENDDKVPIYPDKKSESDDKVPIYPDKVSEGDKKVPIYPDKVSESDKKVPIYPDK
ncbi:MAG: putative DNA binding domain-containing protein, partial [Methanomicrobiales archaeon]|nr:putative DNA binding domain-containing protein [Methanomicrobiales archaeon]